MIQQFNNAAIEAYVRCQAALRREDGQNTLEYIVAVIFIVLAAAVGFQAAGKDITKVASDFVDTVLNP